MEKALAEHKTKKKAQAVKKLCSEKEKRRENSERRRKENLEKRRRKSFPWVKRGLQIRSFPPSNWCLFPEFSINAELKLF